MQGREHSRVKFKKKRKEKKVKRKKKKGKIKEKMLKAHEAVWLTMG